MDWFSGWIKGEEFANKWLERKSRVSELACRRARTVRRLQGSPQAFVMPDGLAYHALRSGPLSQVRRVLSPEVMLRTLLRQRDQGYRPITPGCVIGKVQSKPNSHEAIASRMLARLNFNADTLRELLEIALPMVISQGAFAVMIFTDRYFMSQIDPVHMAAALGGGVACFFSFCFFSGLFSYANALAAQYLGAGEKHKCARVVTQVGS